jgi:hypothetical protein
LSQAKAFERHHCGKGGNNSATNIRPESGAASLLNVSCPESIEFRLALGDATKPDSGVGVSALRGCYSPDSDIQKACRTEGSDQTIPEKSIDDGFYKTREANVDFGVDAGGCDRLVVVAGASVK